MKLEYMDRAMDYNQDGTRKQLRVLLGNSDGAVYPVYLSPDKDSLTNQELYELAMEEIYQINYTMRAENEKFEQQNQAIAEAMAEITKLKDNALMEIRAEINQNREMVKIVTLALNSVLAKIDPDEEEAEEVGENEDNNTTVDDIDGSRE